MTVAQSVARFPLSKYRKFGGLLIKANTLNNVTYKNDTHRSLFTREVIGTDDYHHFRSRVSRRLLGVKGKFSSHMEEYMATEDNVIFSDDLKSMVAIAETDHDLAITGKMIKRYYTQSSEAVIRQFTFGPVIMRMLHDKNKSDLALSLFNDFGVTKMFQHMSCCVILMDMLYEDHRYDDALTVFSRLIDSRKSSMPPGKLATLYAGGCTTATFACFYRQNTPEALEGAKALIESVSAVGANITNRGVGFVGLLCLNQNDLVFGYESLNLVRNQRIPTITNLKIQFLIKLGRLDEAVSLLGGVLHSYPTNDVIGNSNIFPDVLDAAESALKASDSAERLNQFETIRVSLESGGHVSTQTFTEYCEGPIHLRRRGREPARDSRGEAFDRGSPTRFDPPWWRPAFTDEGDTQRTWARDNADEFYREDRRGGEGRWREGVGRRGSGDNRWGDGEGRQARWGAQERQSNKDGQWGGRRGLQGRERFYDRPYHKGIVGNEGG